MCTGRAQATIADSGTLLAHLYFQLQKPDVISKTQMGHYWTSYPPQNANFLLVFLFFINKMKLSGFFLEVKKIPKIFLKEYLIFKKISSII
jgi:hypothetical protein